MRVEAPPGGAARAPALIIVSAVLHASLPPGGGDNLLTPLRVYGPAKQQDSPFALLFSFRKIRVIVRHLEERKRIKNKGKWGEGGGVLVLVLLSRIHVFDYYPFYDVQLHVINKEYLADEFSAVKSQQ